MKTKLHTMYTALLLPLSSALVSATPETGRPQNNLRSLNVLQDGMEDCCDPLTEPGTNGNAFCADGYICCPDNNWSCGIGDGTYPCAANPCFEQIEGERPFGCCDKTSQPGTNGVPSCEPEGSACCPDGTWGCSVGVLNQFDCGGDVLENPTGSICPPGPPEPEPCCEPELQPGTNGIVACVDGLPACCSNGLWACSVDGGGYQCDPDEMILQVSPHGEVCATIQVEPEPDCCNPETEPGTNGNLFCADGYICCPDNNWSCGIGGGTYPCGVDGHITSENANPCFEPIEPTTPMGPVLDCCDPLLEPGTNGIPTCDFRHACCPEGVWACSNGDSTIFPCDNGDFIENPTGEVCASEEEEPDCCNPDVDFGCSSGERGCCPGGEWACPDGETGLYDCQYIADPQGPLCEEGGDPEDLPTTPQGSGGDEDNCDPALKPDGSNGDPICADGAHCCPNGSWTCGIGDGSNPCQPCCDPELKPPGCFEGSACCPDGTWGCSTGAASQFACGGDILENPTGPVCEKTEAGCCDSADMPLCFIGTAACCPQGTWTCPNGFTNLYPCGPTQNPSGLVCDTTDSAIKEEPLIIVLCFPGDATVSVKTRGNISMKDLKLGDDVLTETGTYSKVYSFGHYQPNVNAVYMQLTMQDTSLKISKDHMVFTDSATSSVAAGSLKVGDKVLLSTGSTSTITKIRTSVESGAFAPFTESGLIAVNGVVASNYIAMDDNSLKLFGMEISRHWLAHASQAPHRVYCRIVGGCQEESYTADGISHWVATPYLIGQFLFHQHPALQVLAFMFLVPFLAAAAAVEAATTCPVLMAATITTGLCFMTKKSKN